MGIQETIIHRFTIKITGVICNVFSRFWADFHGKMGEAATRATEGLKKSSFRNFNGEPFPQKYYSIKMCRAKHVVIFVIRYPGKFIDNLILKIGFYHK